MEIDYKKIASLSSLFLYLKTEQIKVLVKSVFTLLKNILYAENCYITFYPQYIWNVLITNKNLIKP